jgi:predicted protein tyrosine phosphatase
LFKGHPRYEARSGGTETGARIKVTAGHIGWADMIFCMEQKHADRLHARFPEEIANKPLVTLRIPDHYRFMDPELIELLRAGLGAHVRF